MNNTTANNNNENAQNDTQRLGKELEDLEIREQAMFRSPRILRKVLITLRDLFSLRQSAKAVWLVRWLDFMAYQLL